ncbi:adenylate/guanylate cyclase domain-containing protein [Candidatus Bipolaricaulota bacterium]|nr:adenylate/guanylate cyclase domain-containing protein [Candidatus Bipolaricaulota bacterium]
MSSDQPIAVQFSDLRGFSSYTAQHGDEKAFQIARQFIDLVGAKVEQHGGRLLKTYGDGVMTSFDDPERAVRCAVAMQATICQEYCGGDDGDPAISAGIGLTWGTAIQTDGDLFGHSVNLAKRLADEAKGGQIVASSSVVDETGDVDGVSFRNMGTHNLKGVGEHKLYEVVWRAEVARLETIDRNMDIILTEDQKVIVELGKSTKEKLEETLRRLEEGTDEFEGSGMARFLKSKLAKRLAKSLPTWIDWAQDRAGMGMEHALHDVQARFEQGKLTLMLGEHRKPLLFNAKDLDPAAAQAFVERLERMKELAAPPHPPEAPHNR